jgi:hypothetical protein
MPFDIYVGERPRTLAVVPRDTLTDQPRFMLVLEHKRGRDTKAAITCGCALVPVDRPAMSRYVAPLNTLPVVGILGLLHVGTGE